MSPGSSRAEFLQNLSDSALFAGDDADSALESLLAPASLDGEEIARRLIAAGRLTHFQAAAVRERRFPELAIGNYCILDRLGVGGMGTVYKARHRRMKRIVAVKVLFRTTDQSEKFLQRFQREIEAIARMNHRNIVMAFDADEAPVGPYLVMEFVDGCDLAAEVRLRGPLPVAAAAGCVLQAARALDYAHAQGVIHRDIKPANLMLDARGVVKVADLGLARLNDDMERRPENANALTQHGTVMGTVDFMSPEQAVSAADIDLRTDIYSLGCTLHHLLTGRAPYNAPSMMAILLKHRDAEIPSLAAARAETPLALDRIFQRMVAKKPGDRFASMAEVVRALEELELVAEGEVAHLLRPAATASAASHSAVDLSLSFEAMQSTCRTIGTVELKTLAPPEAEKTALLVEPSRMQAGIIRDYLHKLGFQQVLLARSGKECLELATADRSDYVISQVIKRHAPGGYDRRRTHKKVA